MDSSRSITVAEHIQELRRRLMWTLLFLTIGAVVGYLMHDQLIWLLQAPLHDRLYYTTPGGAFSFIIKVCTVFGLIIALPVLIYQVFAYFGPLIQLKTKRSFVVYVVSSFLLAVAGIAFAYMISLPAALEFLVNFGSDSDIKSMITANEYFNFVLTYIAGFAILFQVPLLVLLIDKLKPMPPKKMLGVLRHVVLVSFILAAVITPTPDPINQTLMAGPIILLYLFSVGLIALRSLVRRRKKMNRAMPITPPQLSVESADLDDIAANLMIDKQKQREEEEAILPDIVDKPSIHPSAHYTDIRSVARQRVTFVKPSSARPRLLSDISTIARTRPSRAAERRVSSVVVPEPTNDTPHLISDIVVPQGS